MFVYNSWVLYTNLWSQVRFSSRFEFKAEHLIYCQQNHQRQVATFWPQCHPFLIKVGDMKKNQVPFLVSCTFVAGRPKTTLLGTNDLATCLRQRVWMATCHCPVQTICPRNWYWSPIDCLHAKLSGRNLRTLSYSQSSFPSPRETKQVEVFASCFNIKSFFTPFFTNDSTKPNRIKSLHLNGFPGYLSYLIRLISTSWSNVDCWPP